jgi:hypothetical protein
LRKILFSLVTFLALLLVAEVGITLLSQHGMEKALSSQYELPSSLEVNINSFPYLLSLARNHMGEVQLSWKSELPYHVGEDAAGSMAYEGRVNLYDVELNMPSLLTGKLELRHISRQKATISMDLEELKRAFGFNSGTLFLEDDSLFMRAGGEKTRCKVKVVGDDGLTIEPYGASTDGSGSYLNPDCELETVEFPELPIGAILLNASLMGDRVILEISIPMWEGYL